MHCFASVCYTGGGFILTSRVSQHRWRSCAFPDGSMAWRVRIGLYFGLDRPLLSYESASPIHTCHEPTTRCFRQAIYCAFFLKFVHCIRMHTPSKAVNELLSSYCICCTLGCANEAHPSRLRQVPLHMRSISISRASAWPSISFKP